MARQRKRSANGMRRQPQTYSIDNDVAAKVSDIAKVEDVPKSQVLEDLVISGLAQHSEWEKTRPAILTFLNFKGGVGKTTSASSLAYCLGQIGKKVLIIDFDPQGNSSMIFGVYEETEDSPCIVDVLFGDETNVNDYIVHTSYDNVDIIPANMRFLLADSYFRNEGAGSETLLKYAIEDLGTNYDYIIIDCRPSLDMTITNALVAMEAGNKNSMVILPIKIEGYAFAGAPQVLRTIKQTAKSRRKPQQKAKILVTVAEANTLAYKEGLTELADALNFAEFFDTTIPKSTKANESTLVMMPLPAHAPSSPAARAYATLAREIVGDNDGE